jgi:hypothetical protein
MAEKKQPGDEKTMDDKNTSGNTALSAAPAKVIVRKTKPKVAASVAASVPVPVPVPTDDTDQ